MPTTVLDDKLPRPSASLEESEPWSIHILVWVVCATAWLGLMQLLIPLQGYGTACGLRELLECPAVGAALGGLLMWAKRRWQGIRFPVSPGEFLIILFGTVFTARTVELLLIGVYPWGVIPFAVLTRLAMVGICVLAVCRSTDWVWKGFFVLQVVTSLCFLAVYFPKWTAAHVCVRMLPTCLWISLILLIVALLCGFYRHRRFPWTHWLGVGILVWSVVIEGSQLLFRYYQ